MNRQWLKKMQARVGAAVYILMLAVMAAPTALLNAGPAQYNPVSNAEDVIYPSNNPTYTLNTFQPIVISPNGALRVDNNVQNNYLTYTSSVVASIGGYGVTTSTIGVNTSTTTGIGLQYLVQAGFSNGALQLKTTPGFIAGIQVSSACSAGGVFNIYDTVSATTNAPQVASVNCSTLQSYTSFDLATSSGLYVTWSGTPGTFYGFTLSWR